MAELQGWTVTGFFEDNDRSASDGKARPAWERLIADIKAGRIDAVVVWNQDRGWRKMADLEELRPVFAKHGVKLATTNIGVVDFNNADDVFRTQVSTALSEMEIAKMRVRQKRAARQKAESGRPQWRNAFGFKWRDSSTEPIELDPVTAPLVQQVYRDILAGGSISDGARFLNDAGALPHSGKPWSPSTLSLYLRKPRNCGLREHCGEIVGKGTWPPIVDEPLWRSVQTVLNGPGRAPGPKSVQRHTLTGILRCGRDGCGGYMVGSWQRQATGGPKAYTVAYSCRECRRCSVRAEHAEPIIRRLVAERLTREDARDLLRSELHDTAEAERRRVERSTLLTRLDEIADERADGLLTGAQAKRATERIQQRIHDLDLREADADRVQVLADLPLGTEKVGAALKALSQDRYRAVVTLLLDVTVQPVGKGGAVFRPERVLDGVSWKV